MIREMHSAGLLLLVVFLNLFFVQLACSLPHLMQKLGPPASAYQENDSHGHNHSHDNTTANISSRHHNSEDDSHNSCCTEQSNSPFIKSSVDSCWSAFVKGQTSPLALLTYTFYNFFTKSVMEVVSHAPPEDLPPKIPDIRIFLQSLILFDILYRL
ncbi:hypothetical protein K0O23_16835 [Pontibacter aydingkolensis]|uniref:Uncharacterized protein n=2 Tax=Pontibacter aydingkolensis TaxID=1911536 RepID=A0ABS7CY27_9BACT|nr:hypothetical protein [Pontibacter aydingkolensis]